MDDNYHIFSDGRLERAQDTLRVVTDDDTHYLPVENAEALFLHGQLDFNTRLVSFLNDEGVALHVFGWNDYYAGSVMPERGQTSGATLLEQARTFDDPSARLTIAKAFIDGSIHNMRTNVTYYANRDYDVDWIADDLTDRRERLGDVEGVEEAMGIEASARRSYYQLFDAVLPEEWAFTGRQYNPPDNKVNSLISFGNSLVYASTVSAIRATALDPAISFLHEPGDRRYSLALDIADVFKPLLADRVIFRVVNRGQLDSSDFESDLNSCLLTEDGRQTYSKEFEQTLETTVDHPKLNRKVSYQYLLRIEAYKLKKHVLTGELFEPFRRWW